MSSSRSSRSKSKESAVSTRIKLLAKETNGTDDDTEEDPININSEESSQEESSSANEKEKKKKLDSSLSKSGFSMTTEMKKLLERVLCCSCGKQLNPMNPGAVRRHPWLKVVTCKKCYKFLRSGPFTRDDDGIDEQCRWCGDGGRLYGCDYCHNCFCRSCIKRNLGRSEASMMESEDDSKWHCYLCKPKKLKKLTEDCDKILGFIRAQEKKERERAEREKAKQKEKEKREKLKKEEKNEENEKDDKEVKTTVMKGLPAPKSKSEVKTEKIKVEKSDETSTSAKKVENSETKILLKKVEPSKSSNSTPDIILIGGSSDVVDNPHHRAVKYRPDIRTGVQHVKKINNNLTAVTVGPKFDKPVVVPTITKGGSIQRQIQPKPMLVGMLTGATGSNFGLDRGFKKTTPLNDLRAMKSNIFPHNVENIAEKLSPIAQSLNLTLNSIKTDIAIAKLSQANMYQTKQVASTQLKNGLEYFFNNVRELIDVQIVAKNPNDIAEDMGLGDINTISGPFLTSTPNGKQEALVNVTPKKLDDSIIPIEIDPSPAKKKENVEKMETDDDVYVVTDNDTKDVKVLHVSNDKVVKEESMNQSEISKKDEIVLDDDSASEKGSNSENTKPVDNGKDLDSAKEAEQASESKSSENTKDSKETLENEVQEISDTESDEKAPNKSKSKLDMSENTAAELELLKEMADELNEQEEKSRELDQPRRSSRKKNTEVTEDKDESDRESPVRRSSRQRHKPEEGKTEKNEKRDENTPEKRKTDSKKSGKKNNDVSSEPETRNKRKSGNRSKVIDDSDDQTEEEADQKEEEKDSNKSKVSSKKSSDSKVSSDATEENTEEEEGGLDTEPETKSSGKSSKKNSEKQKAKSRDRSKSAEESCEEVEEEGELDTEPETKTSAKSSKKSSEKQKAKSRDRSKSAEESCEEVEDKKKKKSEEKNKKDSKKSKKVVNDEEYDKALEDQVPTDMSDTTESSDESVQEFGKRKKKRKAAVKEESETSRRQTRRRDKGKKSENNTENSDSDPNFDSDLEKEIKNLSRSTRLKRRAKESKDSGKEEKKDKSKEKEGKKGKKAIKDDVSDLSTGPEDVPEVKTSKRTTRQTADKKSENTTENSDSDPDFDSDLEKDIKSLSKETRLSRSKAKEVKESKEIKKEESKVKEEKSKGKGGKKETKAVKEEDSDLSSGEDDIPPEDDDDSEDNSDNNLSASQIKKIKQASKAMIEEDSDDDDRPDDLSSDSTDDPEVSFPKLTTPKKGKKKELEDLSEDSDFITPKKKRKKGVIKDKLLDVDISGSESDTGKKGKGKKGKRKRKKEADSDAFSELSDEEENRKKGKKRRRIKKIASSDEEALKGSNEEGSDMEDDGTPGKHKRKQIRKVIGSKKLTDETKRAQKAEEERRKRIEERQKEYNTYVEVEGGEEDEEEVPEGTEREMTTPTKAADSIAQILGSPRKVPVTTKCVLEMDKEKKKIQIEVDRTLVRKLKPHQVEAVRFMYNCCVESVNRMKKEKGAGCILAHCMGLGKTLSVITFVHTMLSNVKLTSMSKCLVVCPLNTTLNWVNEFEIWLDDVDFEIEVYEMSKVKQNFERAQMLKEWHEGGAGVMILGYDMYRNLVNGSHCKNKKQKKIFYETLADPGPDIVVCDEGHILKNDATSLSKAMTKINSRRRVVLTGTPLQNNLGEYHCMVDFVKPSLLGTRKEFNNRFCNPITNGQCSDSTPFDVKLMKHRSHILHELLAGCVQRKDYSALTKYLPPKFEYVISVRLSEVQMTLYEKYLNLNVGAGEVKGKGARLFTDYQALMRIWTHPWVLKLDEIRQENKRQFDDEDDDSFINDSGSDEDSFIDDSTTSPSSSDDESGGGDKKKKKKRKTRGNKGSSSSDEDSKKENPDEVVKKWTSKRRGNEEGAGTSWMEEMGYSTGPKEVTTEWWAEFVKEEDEFKLELSGKMTLMFEILKMCEDIGDKVLVFSQSLLSLDIIEDFLTKIDEANNPINEANDANKPSTSGEASTATGTGTSKENKEGEKTQEEKNKEKFSQYGKSWSKGLDYFRMDGSTNSQNRKASQDMFNDPENYRARLFLISTKAGSLGINLVSANRVIIFDASWNPSHDIQSIFRVYRFGQVKPVYVYRFLAQGTMEEKIYERQVTKQSLSQRVVDEHQIERHFTSSDLQELYKFQPDRLNDPTKKSRPLPILPKDHMLAELMTNNKEWIVTYHEHDSLLENVIEQELTEDEKKAAWEDYEDEKKGISKAMGGMHMNPALLATQQMSMQNLLMQGQANLGQAAVLQIVQDLKTRFPNLPPEVFQQRVQAVLRQVLTQQIMQQSDMQRRQLEQQRMNELNRLNQIKQQIQRQQAMINNQQRIYGMGATPGLAPNLGMQSLLPQGLRPQTMSQLQIRGSGMNTNLNNDQQKK